MNFYYHNENIKKKFCGRSMPHSLETLWPETVCFLVIEIQHHNNIYYFIASSKAILLGNFHFQMFHLVMLQNNSIKKIAHMKKENLRQE